MDIQEDATTGANYGQDTLGRLDEYKNLGKDVQQMRRKRFADALTLRKLKRDETLLKRRNVPRLCEGDDEEDDNNNNNNNNNNNCVIEVDEARQRILGELTLHACPGNDISVRLKAMTDIRKAVCCRQRPPIEELVTIGALPVIADCLRQAESCDLQFEAVWVLTNVTSGTAYQTRAAVEAGVVPLLINLLDSPDNRVQEQAVWALANIIGEGPRQRDYCINAGLIPILWKFARPETAVSFLRQLAWAVANLCRNDEPLLRVDVVKQLLGVTSALLQLSDATVIANSLWAISFLIDPGCQTLQCIIDFGLVGFLVQFFESTDPKVLVPLLRVIGNLTTGSDEQTQALLDAGVLRRFEALLTSPTEKVSQNGVWILSNILAGTERQVQDVLDAGLLPYIVRLMAEGNYETRKEAAWALSNVSITASPTQLEAIIGMGAIPPLCGLLTDSDSEIVRIVLNTLSNFLRLSPSAGFTQRYPSVATQIEECGGVDSIEQAHYWKNENVSQLASYLIDTYWPEAEDISDDIADKSQPESLQFDTSAVVPENGFQF